MFSEHTFRNLDNEFNDILLNFVYEEMSEKNKNETKENSIMANLSTYFSEKYGGKVI